MLFGFAGVVLADVHIKRLDFLDFEQRNDEEANEESDVDLLLDRGNGVRGWEIGGLYTDLSEALGKELDLVTVTGADDDFLGRIREDEVVLYEQP